MKSHARYIILLATAQLASLGYAKDAPKPLFADPSFDPMIVDRLAVFVVDLNNDPAGTKDCVSGIESGGIQQTGGGLIGGLTNEALSGGNTGPGVNAALAARGYRSAERRSQFAVFYDAQAVPAVDQLDHPAQAWLDALGSRTRGKSPSDVPTGRWIAIITIDTLGSQTNAIKGAGLASLSFRLYDRDNTRLLWHDETDSKIWHGVLGNVMLKGDAKRNACSSATSSMIVKLPKKTKR